MCKIFKILSKAVLFLAILAFSVNPVSASAEPVLDIIVTSPWLALLTNFIGGVNVKVTSIQDWNDDGELIRKIRVRNLQSLPQQSLLMAFDYRDAKGVGLPYESYPNYRPLYERLPLDENRLDVSLSDPSIMPFIAQRVLTVLADWDPSNYPYYQRRLAEFQARLYSTILAGRQLLKDQAIFDLTGHSTFLLQAAGCKLTPPSPAELAAWGSWKEMDRLTARIAQCAADKAAVVVDYSTPKSIRSTAASKDGVFLLTRPRLDQDYPAFLQDQYLSLWSKITSKPLPTPARRRP